MRKQHANKRGKIMSISIRYTLEEDIKRLKSEVIEGQKGVKDHGTLVMVNKLLNSYLMHKQDLGSLFKARHYLHKAKVELVMADSIKFNNELFGELKNLY